MKTKQCSKCKEVKPVEGFGNNKTKKDGLRGQCKACEKQYRTKNRDAIAKRAKQYRQDNKEASKQYRQTNKEALAKKQKQYYQANKEKIRARSKQYYQDNKDFCYKKHKQYCQDNRDALTNWKRLYERARRAEDPVYRMVGNMRSRLSAIFRHGTAKDETTMELVGCTMEHLQHHMEAQFTEGMHWDNYGTDGWVCDHIQPVASFDQLDSVQRKTCWHYTNLQPMWYKDNLIKRDKDPGEHQVRLL